MTRVPGDRADGGRRFENIDALRGLAALLVVWLHVSEVFVVLPGVAERGTDWGDVAEILNVGRIGVIAFFAISGFVIVPTVRGPRGPATRDFAIKRFFRLFPPFWSSMAFAAVTVWWLFGKDLDLATVAANATMIPIEWNRRQMMGHYWTLEVELIFYAVVLLLFWSGRLSSSRTIAWAVVALAIGWPLLGRLPYGELIVRRNAVWEFLSYFLSVMFWGSLVRRRIEPGAPRQRIDWPLVVVSAIVFGRPVIAILFGSPTVHQEDWRGTFLGLVLLLAFLRVPGHRARPFVWLGTISYSLYLVHPAIFYPLFRFARDSAWDRLPLLAWIVISMGLSIAVAGLLYRVVELPSNRFARHLVGRREVDHLVMHRAR